MLQPKRDGAIYYEMHGKGEPLVLINGMVRTAAHWGGFEQVLSRHFQVITFDHRGMGRTTAPLGWRADVRDMAADVASLLDFLGIPSAHIVGLSLGGMVAMSFGLHFSRRAETLQLMNTSIGGAGLPRASKDGVSAILKGFLRPKQIDRILEPVLLSPGRQERRQEIRALWDEQRREFGFLGDPGLKQWIAVKAFKGPKSLAAIVQPTQIIFGTQDRLVLPANAQVLHRNIPRSLLTPIEGGGHEMTLDMADEVAQAIVGFVEAQAPARRVA